MNKVVEQQQIEPIPLKWFGFRQNNSGGEFIVDKNLAHDVFIQATSAKEAIRRAEEIGLDPYQDYCHCCGPRWNLDIDDDEGFAQPTKYGKLYSENSPGWFRDEGRFHYIDGHVEVVYPGKEQDLRLT